MTNGALPHHVQQYQGRLDTVTALLQQNADPAKADGMRAYMRNQFQFLGVPTPARRKLTRPAIKELQATESIDWDFVDACWQNQYREFQYVAVDYLAAVRERLQAGDLPRIKRFIKLKPW
jgi:DNA-7-methylguanine glycosylase (EC 3.2.2.-)